MFRQNFDGAGPHIEDGCKMPTVHKMFEKNPLHAMCRRNAYLETQKRSLSDDWDDVNCAHCLMRHRLMLAKLNVQQLNHSVEKAEFLAKENLKRAEDAEALIAVGLEEKARLQQRLTVAELLIDSRDEILKKYPCPVHGQCIPYVMVLLQKGHEFINSPKCVR